MTTLPLVFSWGYRCHHVRRKQDLHQQKNVVLMHIVCGSSQRNLLLQIESFGSSQRNMSARINYISSQKNLQSVPITIYYVGFCCQWHNNFGSLLNQMIYYHLLHNNSLSLILENGYWNLYFYLLQINLWLLYFFLCGATAPLGPRPRPNIFRHTQPVGLLRTNGQLVTKPAAYKTHTKHNSRIFLPSAGIKTSISALQRI